jgi:hypothetical protein
MVRKLRPQARDVNQPPEPNRSAWADWRCQSASRTKPIGVGGLQASTRFLGVAAIRLLGDRRLQAERTKAGAPLPMALLVKLDRLAEALHLTQRRSA